MKWAVITATKGGLKKAFEIKEKIEVDIYSFKKAVEEQHHIHLIDESLSDFVGRIFNQYDTLVFIMATGIVVRVISSYIKDKTKDPAVLVMDEEGKYVISLLSGHLGGANEKAIKLAEHIKGHPVITTASDTKGVYSVDMLAKELNCVIDDMKKAKTITALIVNELPVGIKVDKNLEDPLDSIKIKGIKRLNPERKDEVEGLIYISNRVADFKLPMVQLIPQNIVVGIGCRKNYDAQTLLDQLKHIMQKNSIHVKSIKKVATISLKRHEGAIVNAANALGVQLQIVSTQKIKAIEQNFSSSQFVKKIVGIGSVAEPCGYIASNKGRLVVPKTIMNGMTMSVWEEKNG